MQVWSLTWFFSFAFPCAFAVPEATDETRIKALEGRPVSSKSPQSLRWGSYYRKEPKRRTIPYPPPWWGGVLDLSLPKSKQIKVAIVAWPAQLEEVAVARWRCPHWPPGLTPELLLHSPSHGGYWNGRGEKMKHFWEGKKRRWVVLSFLFLSCIIESQQFAGLLFWLFWQPATNFVQV